MTGVVVCGIAGQLPLGGVAMHYVQYCLGLRDLGLEPFYLEDNGAWPYHPWENRPDEDAAYSVPWLREVFTAFDLPWAYRDPRGRYHGATRGEVLTRCHDAALLLNISGGHEPEDHHRAAEVLAFVDTDPGFVHVAAARGDTRTRSWLEAHDVLFTFAEGFGRPGCRVPDAGFTWHPTRQPVYLPFWADVDEQPGDVYTTVMNWHSYDATTWEGEAWGQKDAEFHHVRDLPRRTGLKLEVALGGADAPRDALRSEGWRVVDPLTATETIWTFRDYVAASRAELTVAKQAYVRGAGGWFSERSANYLAAGRPVITQETGWSAHVDAPDGGLFAFADADEAAAAIRAVEADPVGQGRAAREVARREFDARTVLTRLLQDAGVA